MKNFPLLPLSGLLLVAITFSACETPTGQGAGIGAASGAIIGAIAGGNVRSAGIGAAAGALTGAVIGKSVEENRRAAYGSYEVDRAAGMGYRVARPTQYVGYVRSPYAPYALVDVRGIPHGARVLDPTSDRVFVNP